MSLLGFDTALPTTSACLVRDDGEAFSTPPPPVERLLGAAAHSQELMPALAGVLERAGVDWGAVGSLAVGIGPGTFTGLRIGVATARALGQALDVGVRPVSSLHALAAGVANAVAIPEDGRVLALIDARRGQVFAALYRVAPRGAVSAGRLPRQLVAVWEPVVLDPAPLLQRLRELHPAPVCAGDWAVRSRAELEGAGAEVPPSDSGAHGVDALCLCRLAADVAPVAPEHVFPEYLRLPDAELNRRRLLTSGA